MILGLSELFSETPHGSTDKDKAIEEMRRWRGRFIERFRVQVSEFHFATLGLNQGVGLQGFVVDLNCGPIFCIHSPTNKVCKPTPWQSTLVKGIQLVPLRLLH